MPGKGEAASGPTGVCLWDFSEPSSDLALLPRAKASQKPTEHSANYLDGRNHASVVLDTTLSAHLA
jgi:hypothetical protein